MLPQAAMARRECSSTALYNAIAHTPGCHKTTATVPALLRLMLRDVLENNDADAPAMLETFFLWLLARLEWVLSLGR